MISEDIRNAAHRAEPIFQSEEFYNAKAREEWEKWKSAEVPMPLVELLLNIEYPNFCTSTDSEVVAICEQIFRMIAYFDSKAKDKNLYNDYPDKRTVAQAGIYQGPWVKFLLKYKRGDTDFAESYHNLINYLENPSFYFPILSEDHKALIYTYFIGEEYKKDEFETKLIDYFSNFVNCKNPENFTTGIVNIIYALSARWNTTAIKGLFAHDNTGWQEDAVSDSNGGPICIWWHRGQPKEIVKILRKIIDSGDTFDLYYIQANQAVYKATIADFATSSEEYESKKADWISYSPKWFQPTFSDYNDNDGKREAAIVFLASKFERLNCRFPVELFVRYKNMSYNPRGGMPAFTRILSKNLKNLQWRESMFIEEVKNLLLSKHNVILQGAPGTGKTYNTAAIALKTLGIGDVDYNNHKDLMSRYKAEQGKRIFFTTFHQSFDYEDFVEGLKPVVQYDATDSPIGVTYEPKAGIFKEACEAAANQSVVLIIDEINRGNVSKIFGDLITLLESDKRTGGDHPISAKLPYSKDPFSVPSNLYIIGTMNTTDRSTGTLDYALRRRFAFVTLKADVAVIEKYYAEIGDDALKDVAVALFSDIQKFIENPSHLCGDFNLDDLMVGHSYFMAKDAEKLRQKIKYEVIPLIEEYINDGILNVVKAEKEKALAAWSDLKIVASSDEFDE